MRFQGEIPHVENRRAGPGWWMDQAGVWRSPREWPEDYPPIRGWVRDTDGAWAPPTPEQQRRREDARWTRPPEPVESTRESRRARADKRDMLLVTGAMLGVLVVLVGALILITQAGATDEDAPVTSEPETGVIYAAETRAALQAQREAAAESRPAWAEATLASLPAATTPPESAIFEPDQWIEPDEGCLSVAERALLATSSASVAYADDFECVVDTGRWSDRYQGRTLSRAIDVEVVRRIPLALVHAAGAWEWDRATRDGFLTDLAHPAMYEIVAAGSGHNPREEGPDVWRPARESTWCAYAIDWISVKQRWSLSVDEPERTALADMLGTCGQAGTDGADPDTTPIEEPALPPITFEDA